MPTKEQLLKCCVLAWFLGCALFGIAISLFAESFQKFSGHGDGALYRDWVHAWLAVILINNVFGMILYFKRPGVLSVLVWSAIFVFLTLSMPVY